MITVTELKVFHNLPFNEYLSLPGRSFSSFKEKKVYEATEKMKLGTAVHNYMAKDGSYNGEYFNIVRPIAQKINQLVPQNIKSENEISGNCILTYEGYRMLYKFRIDKLIMNVRHNFIIDYKITEQPLNNTLQFFGYDNQIEGYLLPFNSRKGFIVAGNPKTLLIETAIIPPCFKFWGKKVKDFGEEIKTVVYF